MLKITKNGRKIAINRRAHDLMVDFRAFAARKIADDVRAQLGGVTCPMHVEPAKVRVELGGHSNAHVSVDACYGNTRATIPTVIPQGGN